MAKWLGLCAFAFNTNYSCVSFQALWASCGSACLIILGEGSEAVCGQRKAFDPASSLAGVGSEGDHEQYGAAHAAEHGEEETDGSEDAAHQDAADGEEGLGEEEDEEEGNEVHRPTRLAQASVDQRAMASDQQSINHLHPIVPCRLRALIPDTRTMPCIRV